VGKILHFVQDDKFKKRMTKRLSFLAQLRRILSARGQESFTSFRMTKRLAFSARLRRILMAGGVRSFTSFRMTKLSHILFPAPCSLFPACHFVLSCEESCQPEGKIFHFVQDDKLKTGCHICWWIRGVTFSLTNNNLLRFPWRGRYNLINSRLAIEGLERFSLAQACKFWYTF